MHTGQLYDFDTLVLFFSVKHDWQDMCPQSPKPKAGVQNSKTSRPRQSLQQSGKTLIVFKELLLFILRLDSFMLD